MSLKNKFLEALKAKYEAQIKEAELSIQIYTERSVGIGEHPQHLEEIDKYVSLLSDASDKLEHIHKMIENEN
jgi:hypothetical protein